MRILLYFIFIFFISSCVSQNKVYWCGDHPCINKKEKEAYFNKTMIVEVRTFDKKNKSKNSQIEKLMKQAKIDEKERIANEKIIAKQKRIDEKRKAKLEKELIKEQKLLEKNKLKEQKRLQKKNAKKEKKLIKKQNIEKKKPIKNDTSISQKIEPTNNKLKEFDELVENIMKKDSLRPYPDINDIPN
tara:strand:+ start:113 stop:673 length:561 start_codon:yes stop_codon:yes gene_type:complete